jgi:hypothetical protein
MSEAVCRPLMEVLAEVPDFRKCRGKRHSLDGRFAQHSDWSFPFVWEAPDYLDIPASRRATRRSPGVFGHS